METSNINNELKAPAPHWPLLIICCPSCSFWTLPVDCLQVFHSALLCDHLNGLWDDIFPLSFESQFDPTGLDFIIVVVVKMVKFLQFGHLSSTKK